MDCAPLLHSVWSASAEFDIEPVHSCDQPFTPKGGIDPGPTDTVRVFNAIKAQRSPVQGQGHRSDPL